jgi:hypothetical protein
MIKVPIPMKARTFFIGVKNHTNNLSFISSPYKQIAPNGSYATFGP